MFSEKLELLMRLTATRNNELSRALHIDEATVSRLRTGKREPPRDTSNLKPMCAFFAGQLKEEYQRQSIAELINPGEPWPLETQQAAERVCEWIFDAQQRSVLFPAERVGAAVPSQRVRRSPLVCTNATERDIFYYGLEGKRAAVSAFFETVIASGKPHTILLFSDESSAWLTDDAQFTRRWEKHILSAVQAGNRLRVIHMINQPLDELAKVISMWMPLYATGKVEPYFYPRLRGGIARRTLFVAPGLAALSATSAGDKADLSLTQLIIEPEAVRTLGLEVGHYLRLCTSILRSCKGGTDGELQKRWLDMDEAKGAGVSAHKALSLATMPVSVARSIARRYNNAQLPQLVDKCLKNFQANILHHSIAEVVILPHPDTTEGMRSRIALPCCPGLPSSFYTREEFASHLERVAQLMRQYDNYYVALGQSPSLLDEITIHYKERFGVMIILNSDPGSAFFFDEDALTAAFGEYLSRWIPYQSAFPRESRDATIAILLKTAQDMRREA